MIYTVGNEQMYLSALKSGKLVKHGRSAEFPSANAKVWESVEAAQEVAEPEMAVFGIEADWEVDTVPDENPDAVHRHLKADAAVVRVPGLAYFENKTPFRMGMPHDHALQTVKKTFRKTRRAPEEVKKDDKGMVVKWFLTDCVLVLRRVEKIGPYVITGIRAPEA